MASQVISFRLSDAEIETLQALQQGDESLAQTASRLIRGLLGTGENDTPQSLNEVVNLLLDERLNTVFARFDDVETRLKKLNP